MLRRSQLGLLPRQDRHRVGKVGGTVGGAADLAVVTVLIRRPAARARSLDVAIRKEHLLHRIVRLGNVLARDVPRLLQSGVDQLGARAVLRRVGGVVVVERNPEVPKIGAMFFADRLDERLRSHPLLLGLEHDGSAVSVVGADIRAAMAERALESHPDVGLDVLHHVPEVNRAVRVRQRARHQERAVRCGHGVDSVVWLGDRTAAYVSTAVRGRHIARAAEMAVGVGFEPTEPLGSLVFKTRAFDHSATPPGAADRRMAAIAPGRIPHPRRSGTPLNSPRTPPPGAADRSRTPPAGAAGSPRR